MLGFNPGLCHQVQPEPQGAQPPTSARTSRRQVRMEPHPARLRTPGLPGPSVLRSPELGGTRRSHGAHCLSDRLPAAGEQAGHSSRCP